MADPLDQDNKRLKSSQEAIDRVEERNIRAAEKRLADAYKLAYKEIEAELAKVYASMGEPPTIAEARKYNRLQTVQDEIAKAYNQATGKAISITDEAATESFATGAMGSRWAIDQATGVEISWPVLPVEAIRGGAYADTAGEDFEERYQNYGAQDRIDIQRHVVQGIAQGNSYSKTARKLRDDIDIAYNRAIRIARTESTRNFTLGKLNTSDSLSDLGIEAGKQWVATLDDRTRDTHGSLDGQLADKDGTWSIDGMTTEGPGLFGDPAEDINCRCSYIDVMAGYEPKFRRIREEEGIVEYKTWTDWATDKGWTSGGGWPKAREARK